MKVKGYFERTINYEPKYEPEKWNQNSNIKGSHNCYAYMLNDINNITLSPEKLESLQIFHEPNDVNSVVEHLYQFIKN